MTRGCVKIDHTKKKGKKVEDDGGDLIHSGGYFNESAHVPLCSE